MNVSSVPKVSIGVLTYNGARYFDYLFPSLFAQDYPNIEILVLDNASRDNDADLLREKWGEKMKIIRKERNLGFAGGHNALIGKMEGDLYLCINQDMFLDPQFVSKLVHMMLTDDTIGAVTGKIYQWDYTGRGEGKTRIIDTVGIRAYCSHRFEDIGQGEEDIGQYDDAHEIFAASGAAILLRREALEDVAFILPNQKDLHFFDDLFFMYKEDIDLGYRLRWAGWKCVYAPHAIAYHDRTIGKKISGLRGILLERHKKPDRVRKWSWHNHHILLKKNFSKDYSWKIKICTFLYELFSHLYVFVFEPGVLSAHRKKMEKLTEIIDFRSIQVQRKVHAKDIEYFFE